jgi:hypothetical protein
VNLFLNSFFVILTGPLSEKRVPCRPVRVGKHESNVSIPKTTVDKMLAGSPIPYHPNRNQSECNKMSE